VSELHHDWREEIWNALSHGFGFLLSLTASAVLVTLVAINGDRWQLAGALVFCFSLVTVYTSSTLYHSIPHLATKARMKVFDHCAIFVLIAGTYTPFTIIALRASGGWWLFAAAWTLAAAGVVFKLFFTGRFKGISTLIYVGMGWMAVLGIKQFLAVVPVPTLLWLLAGGLA
jgi:hemolysin III